MTNKGLLLAVTTLIVLPGCNDSKIRKEIQSLGNEIKTLHEEVKTLKEAESSRSKVTPAFLSPTDPGYDFAIDASGIMFPISIESVDSFPGGVKYVFSVTNIYAVGMSNVELEISFSGQTKKVDIPENIQAGKRLFTPVSFSVDDGKFPKYIFVNATAKGMRFIKQL